MGTLNLKLKRLCLDDCTIGALSYGPDFRVFTLELSWFNNLNSHSCIPAGFYECEKTTSPSKGHCISIKNVVGRTHILIHSGNYTSNTLGCVLVGDSIKDINNDKTPDVTNSVKTMERLMLVVPENFILEISQ